MTSTTITAAQDLPPGETLLWSGVPRQGLFLRSADALLIPFSLLWAGFAVFFEANAIASGPPFFVLWGIPFVAMGLYITIGRFFVDNARRRQTSYALTAQRVVIRSGRRSQSLSLATLADITVTERSRGRGTIVLGAAPFPANFLAGASWPGVKAPPALEEIPDVRQVFERIRSAQQATVAAPAV